PLRSGEGAGRAAPLAGRPAGGVPVAPVVQLPHRLRGPGHRVRRACADVLLATGADVDPTRVVGPHLADRPELTGIPDLPHPATPPRGRQAATGPPLGGSAPLAGSVGAWHGGKRAAGPRVGVRRRG